MEAKDLHLVLQSLVVAQVNLCELSARLWLRLSWMLVLIHLVKRSPWPVCIRLSAFGLVTGFLMWFKYSVFTSAGLSFFVTILLMFTWWRDVSREASRGDYNNVIVDGLKLGMILFILSEVCFFASFFWTFFHISLSPVQELGSIWPPIGITSLNPFHVPLLNTCVLVRRGVRVTWCHHKLLGGSSCGLSLVVTCILGVYFTALQLMEYLISSFTICDRIYGSVFFIATGFHGVHVLVGTAFLLVCLIRLWGKAFSPFHHLGLEIAIWYWHFVDVVWLLLFSCIYWWGC